MFRKLTATLLLALMMVVTGTSQGGVYYCLCLHTLTVGHCGCEEHDDSPQAAPADIVVDGDACHCCHEAEPVEEPRPTLCQQNCNMELHLDLGHFCGTTQPVPALDQDLGVGTLSRADRQNVLLTSRPANCLWSSRAPPDPERPQAVPLYLRNLVFLV